MVSSGVATLSMGAMAVIETNWLAPDKFWDSVCAGEFFPAWFAARLLKEFPRGCADGLPGAVGAGVVGGFAFPAVDSGVGLEPPAPKEF